ncbi:hypothetical protein QPK32_11750 [Massilia sp. YIM B02763]|uniref:hypothetical protein n=1 Tax=Massilia sp. YIM B02763 TaxID=3050130 RepID=UPI0025B678B0|nr:hypothetical protein [Massilia sp. YIM B02763]MDN4053754.1 hypothetical protein [Massilia sp. YIM B02763]
MSLVNRVFQRVRRDFFRWQYEKAANKVLSTRPLERGALPFTLLSMVQKRDVVPYLVAVKSFTHFLNPGRIVVVCDPSIDADDRAVLTRHVPHLELRQAHEFTHPDIPRGGTWERLFAISEYVADSYVIQLDADTLTVQPIPEVLDAVRAGQGFVLGEHPDTPSRPLAAVRENALPWIEPDAHVQAFAEVEMANAGLPPDAVYIRGCSGFTGFPRSAAMRADLTDFSRRMTGRLGEKWTRWGTEQVTSNYLASNAPGTRALPFPKYGTPDRATMNTAFFHFIGSMRFINNKYESTSRHAIRMISSAPA